MTENNLAVAVELLKQARRNVTDATRRIEAHSNPRRTIGPLDDYAEQLADLDEELEGIVEGLQFRLTVHDNHHE